MTFAKHKFFLKVFAEGSTVTDEAQEVGTIYWSSNGWQWREMVGGSISGKRKFRSLEHALDDFFLHLGDDPGTAL